jgi:hypothetical protein
VFPRMRILIVAACVCGMSWLYTRSKDTNQNSADLLRTFKSIYVQSKTTLAKPQMLARELQKNENFDSWGSRSPMIPPPVVIEIDHQPGWLY